MNLITIIKTYFIYRRSFKYFGKFSYVNMEEFELYLRQKDGKLRSYEEHVYPLLILGSLWRIYGGKAAGLGKERQKLMLGWVGLRNDEPLKTLINPVHGLYLHISIR